MLIDSGRVQVSGLVTIHDYQINVFNSLPCLILEIGLHRVVVSPFIVMRAR